MKVVEVACVFFIIKAGAHGERKTYSGRLGTEPPAGFWAEPLAPEAEVFFCLSEVQIRRKFAHFC